MAEETKTLEDLGAISSAPAEQPVHVQKLDAHGRAYATGKRKNAIARVWLKPGNGKILVNDKDFTEYFARPVLQMLLKQPINAAARAGGAIASGGAHGGCPALGQDHALHRGQLGRVHGRE